MPSQVPRDRATTLSRNLKLARGLADLTQRQLAERLKVDSMLVSKWERGWHRPTDENLQALCRELGCSMAWLYTERPASAYEKQAA